MKKTYRKVDGLAWQIMDEQALILEPANKKAHELNSVASTIWFMSNGEKDTDQIAEELVGSFNIDLEEAKKDTEKFSLELTELGLLECL